MKGLQGRFLLMRPSLLKAVSFGLMTGSFFLFSEAAGFAENLKHGDKLPEVVVKEKKDCDSHKAGRGVSLHRN